MTLQNELKVYQIAIKLEAELYNLIIKLPIHHKDLLCKQIIRSSSSISANIIEGQSRRHYKKEFIRFLSIALGSSDETQHHFRILHIRKYIDTKTYEYFAKSYKNLSVRLVNLMQYLKK